MKKTYSAEYEEEEICIRKRNSLGSIIDSIGRINNDSKTLSWTPFICALRRYLIKDDKLYI